jgi:recombination endonuclease VII
VSCAKCGGPKPKGRGRRVCDNCSYHCDEHATMTGSCGPCRRAYYDANPEARDRLNYLQRKAKAIREYNVPEDQVEYVLSVERCQVCGAEGDMHIDHDHETGAYRGVLCANCNKALGLVNDNIETLQGLVTYLAYFKGERY